MARIVLLALATIFAARGGEANCKSTDAKWNHEDRGPRVTQPSRTNADRVLVAWGESDAIKNPRCVDKFKVYAWKKGKETKERGLKQLAEKNAKSVVLEVEPCVRYNFQVEITEKDLWGTNHRENGVTEYATSALPSVADSDSDNFLASYKRHAATNRYDFSKVTVKFPKRVVRNINCVERIEVTIRPEQHGGQGGSRGRQQPGRRQPDGRQPDPRTAYLPIVFPGYPFYTENRRSGSTMHERHGSGHGGGGMSGIAYNPRSGSGSSKRATGGSGGSRGGATTQTVRPPFRTDRENMVSFDVSVPEPCGRYRLSLAFKGPSSGGPGSSVGRVNDIIVLKPSEMQGERPPSLIDLIRHEEPATRRPPTRAGGGSSRRPGGSGGTTSIGPELPPSCMADLFVASERYTAQLEEKLARHAERERRYEEYGEEMRRQVLVSAAEDVTRFGCRCKSPLITLSMSRDSREIDGLGTYGFDGLRDGKPVFKRLPLGSCLPDLTGVVNGTRPSRPGQPDWQQRCTSGSMMQPDGPRRDMNEWLIYWDKSDRTWTVGKVGRNGRPDKSLRVAKASVSGMRCPGDPGNSGKWERSSTFSWKAERGVHIDCER